MRPVRVPNMRASKQTTCERMPAKMYDVATRCDAACDATRDATCTTITREQEREHIRRSGEHIRRAHPGFQETVNSATERARSSTTPFPLSLLRSAGLLKGFLALLLELGQALRGVWLLLAALLALAALPMCARLHHGTGSRSAQATHSGTTVVSGTDRSVADVPIVPKRECRPHRRIRRGRLPPGRGRRWRLAALAHSLVVVVRARGRHVQTKRRRRHGRRCATARIRRGVQDHRRHRSVICSSSAPRPVMVLPRRPRGDGIVGAPTSTARKAPPLLEAAPRPDLPAAAERTCVRVFHTIVVRQAQGRLLVPDALRAGDERSTVPSVLVAGQ